MEAGIAPKKRHGFSLAPYGSSALVTVRRFTYRHHRDHREIDSYIDSYIDSFIDSLQMSVDRHLLANPTLRILPACYGTRIGKLGENGNFLIQVSFSSVVFSTFPVTQRAPLYIASETWQPLLLAAAKASTSRHFWQSVSLCFTTNLGSCQGLEERVWTEVEPLDSDPGSKVVDAANEILLKEVIKSNHQ